MSTLTRLSAVVLMTSMACAPSMAPLRADPNDRDDTADPNASGSSSSSSGDATEPGSGDEKNPPTACGAADPFAADAVRADVTYLASPALGGRVPGSVGDTLARAHVGARFRCLGLLPAGAGSYDVPFVNAGGQSTANVVGWVKGSDPVVGSEIIVVGAHHDHFGTGGGAGLRLGANDNASGVAGLLAIAQSVAKGSAKPRRTIVFAAFGSEETAAASPPFVEGSAAFVKAMPGGLSLSKVVYMVNLDMIGTYRAESTAYVIGSLPNTPARPILDGLRATAGIALSLGDPGEEGGSDFYPFCTAGIPYAFFWTSDDACYHDACDTAERLDYPELGKIAKVSAALTSALADTATDLATFRKSAAVSRLGCK